MDIETMERMDTEADTLISSWSSGPFSEGLHIETCTKKMGTRLNEVYGAAAIPFDLLVEYGSQAGGWILDQGAGLVFGYAVSKVGSALKKVYHDRASGKEAPKPEEFRHSLDFSDGRNSGYLIFFH